MVRMRYQDIDESFAYIKSVGLGKASAIIIFTTYDVDALSSTRMLTYLLKAENIYYSVHMVIDQSSLLRMYEKYREAPEDRIVILMNCGATLNIPRLFGLQRGGSNVRCFVMDNHRPFHLANIYSAYAVVVFDDSAESVSNALIPDEGSDLSDLDESDEEVEDDQSEGADDDGFDEEAAAEEAEAFYRDEEAEFVENEELNESGAEAAGETDDEIEDEGEHAEDAAIAGVAADGQGSDEVAATQLEEEEAGAADSESVTEDGSGEDFQAADLAGDALDVGQEGEGGKRGRDVEGAEEEEEEEEVVRRKRAPDPRRVRRDRLRSYYRASETHSGCPTAFCVLDVVKSQLNNSAVNADLVWQAALGVFDTYARNLIGDAEYSEFVNFLRSDIADLDLRQRSFTLEDQETGTSILIPTAEAGQMRYVSDEYRFFMHRHWSLFDGMLYSPYIGRKFHTWRQQGRNKLQEFLARLGVPLEQCEQHFTHMKPQLK